MGGHGLPYFLCPPQLFMGFEIPSHPQPTSDVASKKSIRQHSETHHHFSSIPSPDPLLKKIYTMALGSLDLQPETLYSFSLLNQLLVTDQQSAFSGLVGTEKRVMSQGSLNPALSLKVYQRDIAQWREWTEEVRNSYCCFQVGGNVINGRSLAFPEAI